MEPEKLRPGMKRPDDFDQFWDAQREILNKVPMKAVLTEVEPAPRKKENSAATMFRSPVPEICRFPVI